MRVPGKVRSWVHHQHPQNRPKANSITELGSTHHLWAPQVLPGAGLPVWVNQVIQLLCLALLQVLIGRQPAPTQVCNCIWVPFPTFCLEVGLLYHRPLLRTLRRTPQDMPGCCKDGCFLAASPACNQHVLLLTFWSLHPGMSSGLSG